MIDDATPAAGAAVVAPVVAPVATAAPTTAAPAAQPATPAAAPAPATSRRPEVTIPKHRFDEVTKLHKAADAELTTLKPQVEQLTKATATLTAQLAFARVGVVDDDHVEAVSSAFAKLPAEGKPATEVEYWQKVLAGEIAAPRTLSGFLPAGGVAVAPGTPAPAPAPRLPAAAPAAPAAAPTVTSAGLTALNKDLQVAIAKHGPTSKVAQDLRTKVMDTAKALREMKGKA